MNDANKGHKVQITVAVIGLVGVLGAAFLASVDIPKLFKPESQEVILSPKDSVDPVLDQRISTMKLEIAYRLQEIRKFLYTNPLTNRSLYNGTQRLTAHGVGISAKFENTELRTLLFELAEIIPENKRLPIDNLITLFDELAAVGPQAPFSDADIADPQKVDLARNKFSQIEREWLRSQ